MPKNLSQIAKQKKIKYFLISFVDLFGVLRSKLVPAQAISEMQKMVQDLLDLQLGWI
jgi:glutamine synthetase